MSIFDLQAAVYGVLDGDAILMAIVDAVYVDMAPKGADFPYVVIKSLGGGAGYQERLAVDVFEQDESLAIIRSAAERIEVLLDGCRHDLGGDYDYAGVFLGVSNVKDKALALCRYASVGGIYGYNRMPFDGFQDIYMDAVAVSLRVAGEKVLLRYDQRVAVVDGIAEDQGLVWIKDDTEYEEFREAISSVYKERIFRVNGPDNEIWMADIKEGVIRFRRGKLVEFSLFRDDFWGKQTRVVNQNDIKNADDATRDNYVTVTTTVSNADMASEVSISIKDLDGAIEKVYICNELDRNGTGAYAALSLSTVFSGTTEQTFTTLTLHTNNFDMEWARVLIKAGTVSAGVYMRFDLKLGSDVLWEGEEIELGTEKIHDLGVCPFKVDDQYLVGSLSMVIYVRRPAGGSYTVTSSAYQISSIDGGFIVIELVNTMAVNDEINMVFSADEDSLYIEYYGVGRVPITPRGMMRFWEMAVSSRVRFWADSSLGVDQDMRITDAVGLRRRVL